MQSTKVLREPIQTTESWRKFFSTLHVNESALRASMHCLWAVAIPLKITSYGALTTYLQYMYIPIIHICVMGMWWGCEGGAPTHPHHMPTTYPSYSCVWWVHVCGGGVRVEHALQHFWNSRQWEGGAKWKVLHVRTCTLFSGWDVNNRDKFSTQVQVLIWTVHYTVNYV